MAVIRQISGFQAGIQASLENLDISQISGRVPLSAIGLCAQVPREDSNYNISLYGETYFISAQSFLCYGQARF